MILIYMTIPLHWCNSQSTPTNPVRSEAIDASVGGHAAATSEGFFLNGSSYVVISDSLNLDAGSLIGFSFRTCSPGELLRQTGDGFDELKLFLDSQGRLILSLVVDDARSEAVVEAGLLDARWHTVLISANEDSNDLTVNVSNGGGSAVLDGVKVQRLDLSASSPQVQVGAGMVACIREGPGVRFTRGSVNSVAVDWLSSTETCLLPTTCSGKQTSLHSSAYFPASF
jgi:hypothetical protein